MKLLRRAVPIGLLLLALVPEVRRHAAERQLAGAQAAVRLARGAAASDPSRARALEWARSSATEAAAVLSGDSRAWMAAAAACLLEGRPEQALEPYRQAYATGERAEIDLNLGRAYAMLDRRPEAFAAFVRAAWISPDLVPDLPAAAQPLVEAELARLEGLLRSGQLAEPPAIKLP
jgi:tetratricopeptide (TPR) repeat protein